MTVSKKSVVKKKFVWWTDGDEYIHTGFSSVEAAEKDMSEYTTENGDRDGYTFYVAEQIQRYEVSAKVTLTKIEG